MENPERTVNRRKSFRTKGWGKLAGNAFLITLVIQLIFAFLGDGPITIALLVEFLFTFFYFLSLLWLYPKISRLMHSGPLNKLRPIIQNFIEAIIIVTTTFTLNLVTKILPMWLLLLAVNNFTDNTWAFDPDAIRQSVVIHAILGLFLYYLFEREKIARQIQAEHLRHENLQREEFRNDLESLKNQVDPEFLFTNLKLLESLIKKDKERANEFVNRLSFLYRSFLENKEQLIPLSSELQVTEAYLELLKFKYEKEFNVINEIPNELPAVKIPPGTTKLLLDHISENKNIGDLKIVIAIEDEDLVFIITASGKNFKLNPEKAEIKKIKEQYAYLTDRPAEFFNTNSGFTVKLPLLKIG